MSNPHKRNYTKHSEYEREPKRRAYKLSSDKVFDTEHMNELTNYYCLSKSRIEQEKLENERRVLEKTNRGVDAIYALFPKKDKFVSFIKDAIDSGITRAKFCDVTCAEFDYRNLLNSAVQYIINRIPTSTRVYISYRESGGFDDSISLIWDWSEMFPSLHGPENEYIDEDGHSTFDTLDFAVANEKLLARHGLKCMRQEDLREFAENN